MVGKQQKNAWRLDNLSCDLFQSTETLNRWTCVFNHFKKVKLSSPAKVAVLFFVHSLI